MRNERYSNQTNTFYGGMNMDLDYSLGQDSSYIYAENIRIVSNKDNSSGVMQQIEGFLKTNPSLAIGTSETIIHTNIIRNYGFVITRDISGTISFYRIDFSSTTDPFVTKIVTLNLELSTPIDTVIRWEDENNIKVYMADGIHQMRVFNMAPSKDASNANITPESLNIIPASDLPQLEIIGFANGQLQSGMIQYAYQLFNIRGSETAISPLSKLYSLSRNDGVNNRPTQDIIGSAKNINSGKALQLSATFTIDTANSFDRIRIYSLHYNSANDLPEVRIVDEVPITDGVFTFTDSGASVLSEITYDEFNTLTSYPFIPKVIETKDNILFAADITEDTWNVEYDARAYRTDSTGNVLLMSNTANNNISFPISNILSQVIPDEHDCICPYNIDRNSSYKYNYNNGTLNLGGVGKNIQYTFVTADLIDSDRNQSNQALSYESWQLNSSQNSLATINTRQYSIASGNKLLVETTTLNNGDNATRNYSNPEVVAKFRSYQGGETYRIGIVLYNDHNIKSPVKWIGDIRMPDRTEPGFELFTHGGGDNNVEMVTHPIGIRFSINNLPADVKRFEIVRCDRTLADRTILTQGIISDLINYSDSENLLLACPYIHYCSNNVYTSTGSGQNNYSINIPLGENASNEYFTFISPEICVNRENSEDLLSAVQDLVPVYGLTSRFVDTTSNSGDVVRLLSTSLYKKDLLNGGAINLYDDSRTRLCGCNVGSSIYLDGNLPYSAALAKYYHKTNIANLEIPISDIKLAPQIDPRLAFVGTTATEADIPWKEEGEALLISTKVYYNWVWDTNNTGVSNDNNNIRRSGPHGVCAIFKSTSMPSTLPRYVNGANDARYNMLGTYLVNLTQSVSPYGGNSYSARQNSTYISTGCSGSGNTASFIVFGGDTYTGVFDYAVMSLEFDQAPGNSDYENRHRHRQYMGAYIPIESSINLSLRNDDVQTSKTYTSNGYSNHLVQNDIIQIGNIYSQDKPLYAYNDAYSANMIGTLYSASALYSIDDLHTDYRIYASEEKTNNEVTDSWTKFKVANYIDLDSQHGAVNKLLTFNNQLLFFQENAFGVVAVNNRSLITDNNPGSLTLGVGDVLSRFDYYSTKNGLKENQLRAITTSDSTVYWYDAHRNEICGFDGSINSVAKLKGVQTYLNANSSTFLPDPILVYDKKYNEALITLEDNTLVFNEQIGAFTSFETYKPDWYFAFTDNLFFYSNKDLYKYNAGDGLNLLTNTSKIAKIRFVVGQDYPITKTFDNVMYPGDFTAGTNFTDIVFNTKRQTSFVTTNEQIDYREDTYAFAIPRSNRELNAAQELVNKSFRDRMKGKYMISEYNYDCNNGKLFKVPYIKTFYRHSYI